MSNFGALSLRECIFTDVPTSMCVGSWTLAINWKGPSLTGILQKYPNWKITIICSLPWLIDAINSRAHQINTGGAHVYVTLAWWGPHTIKFLFRNFFLKRLWNELLNAELGKKCSCTCMSIWVMIEARQYRSLVQPNHQCKVHLNSRIQRKETPKTQNSYDFPAPSGYYKLNFNPFILFCDRIHFTWKLLLRPISALGFSNIYSC